MALCPTPWCVLDPEDGHPVPYACYNGRTEAEEAHRHGGRLEAFIGGAIVGLALSYLIAHLIVAAVMDRG